MESLSILSNPVVNAVDFARLTLTEREREREREREKIDLTASVLVFADVRVTGQWCKHSIFPSKTEIAAHRNNEKATDTGTSAWR